MATVSKTELDEFTDWTVKTWLSGQPWIVRIQVMTLKQRYKWAASASVWAAMIVLTISIIGMLAGGYIFIWTWGSTVTWLTREFWCSVLTLLPSGLLFLLGVFFDNQAMFAKG